MKIKNKRLVSNLITYGIVIAAYIICVVMINNKAMSRKMTGQLIPICCWVTMAVSLNLVVGVSGNLSLGHAGFMSIGAFSGILMSGWLLNAYQAEDPLLRLVLAMVTGGITAGIAGLLIGIPVMRLNGDYLAIVTLAFGEIIRNILNCLYVSVDGMVLRWGFLNEKLPGIILLNGPNGAVKVDRIATFGAGFLLVLFTLFVVLNLINSRTGRAVMAVRDSRIAAESVGINATQYRMTAFVVSAALAGMAGALFGLDFSTLVPAKFKFDQSINVLVFVVLGGIGNITGSVIAAALLTVLPELLRDFSTYRMLVYAIVLILVMLVTNNPFIQSWLVMTRRKLGKKLGRNAVTANAAEGGEQA